MAALSDPSTFITFDLDELVERCMGNKSLVMTLARMFDEQARQSLERMQSALDSGNSDALRREAHSLKGAASYLSTASVRSAAALLEQQAADNLRHELGASLAGLKQAVNECLAELGRLRLEADPPVAKDQENAEAA